MARGRLLSCGFVEIDYAVVLGELRWPGIVERLTVFDLGESEQTARSIKAVSFDLVRMDNRAEATPLKPPPLYSGELFELSLNDEQLQTGVDRLLQGSREATPLPIDSSVARSLLRLAVSISPRPMY